MSRLHREHRGAAFVEFALLLPVLALLAAAAQPLMGALLDHSDVSRAVTAGARYATKVDTNPGNADPICGDFSRRRTTGQVQEYVAATSRVITDPAQVTVVTVDQINGELAHPCHGTAAVTTVTVTAGTTRSSGPLAQAANALSALVGGDGIFREEWTISNSASAYLE